jgi:hypothetical protein
VNGTDLTALDEQARTRFRRKHIGFVFQFFNLIPLLTVEENLLLPLDLNGRADAKGVARARALLERVGLAGRGDASRSARFDRTISRGPPAARSRTTLGLTPRQVWGLVTAQTGIIGLLSGVLAVPSGLLLAAVLVFVINRWSFGWTMGLDPSPSILLQGVVLSILAALLAGLYPAWRMARAEPADALRDE